MLPTRTAGFYVEPASQRRFRGDRAVDRGVLRMGGLPRCGVLQVEATKGSLLSPAPRAVLILPDAAAVAELRQLDPAIVAGASGWCCSPGAGAGRVMLM